MARLSKSQARAQLAALQARRNPPKQWNLQTYLFDKQLAFVTDHQKTLTACTSSRAGKTTSCAADLIDTALSIPGSTGLYITLSRISGKRIIWEVLKEINRTYQLKAFPNEAELTLRFPNNSIIYLMGANTDSEIDKIRGLSNVALIYVDESQAFRAFLQDLVDNVLIKRLYDLDGRLRLIGTPGPIPSGYFHKACHNPNWGHYHWTMHDNPWLLKKSGKTPEQLTAEDCAIRGVTLEDPSIRRENFGEWALDMNALMLTYNPAVNHYDKLPEGKYTYILGIDVGYRDCDALAVLAYSDMGPETYLVEEVITGNQLVPTLAKQIQDLDAKYHFKGMYADTGGLGLKVIETLIFHYGLVIEPADKAGKIHDYSLLNSALRTGMFKAKHDSVFAQDTFILKKDRDKSTSDKTVVDGHSDAVDATLYAFAFSPAYRYVPPKFKAKVNSPEWVREQEDLMKQNIMEKLKRDQALKDGSGVSWTKTKDGKDPWHDW